MALHRLAALRQQPFPMAARPQALPAPSHLGRTLWLTGLSGAGKSALAQRLVPMLRRDGLAACMVDGDQLRHGLSRDLGFREADRAESVRRAAELACLLNQQGIYAVVALISPLAAHREAARRIVGEAGYLEVYIETPLDVCEQRDPKGLYARARRGEIAEFTGISSAYEAPLDPALAIDTQVMDIQDCCRLILDRVRRHP